MTTTARPLGNGDPKGINMAVQSENERNKAVVDEYVAAWGGGFPIKVNGEVVGAIGLSGTPAVQNDVDCAKAALALIPDGIPEK